MKPKIAVLGFLFVAAGAGPALATTAGVVQFVAGEVRLMPAGGAEREARRGVPVNVGDTVVTAPGAMAQLKMGDGAIIVVQPESRLTVAEFNFTGKEDGSERVRYRLERGGFRAVTGAIGRTHKQNYLIETPIAHMGVRGTDHESYYFPDAGPINGEPAKPGAYNKVNTGRTFLRTSAGELEIRPNEVGYVASAGQVPVLLPALPGFFNRSVTPRSAGRQISPTPEATQTAQEEKAQDKVEEREKKAESTDERKRVVESSDGRRLDGRRSSGNATGPLVGYSHAGKGASANGLAVSPNGAVFANAGGNAAWGVDWGSWQGGLATVGGVATSGSTQVIESSRMTSAAQLATLPANLVKATYSYVGGPAPTDQAGIAGTVNSLNVGVNFSKQRITSYALSASAGGANWTANGSGSFGQFMGASGISLSGSCAGCTSGAGTPAASGTAHGGFVGDAAQKMITSFGLTAANKTISGAAFLSR